MTTFNNIISLPTAYIYKYSVPNHQEIKQILLPKILNEYESNKHKKSYRWNPDSQSNITTNYSIRDSSLLSHQQQLDIVWNAMDAMFDVMYDENSIIRPSDEVPIQSKLNSCWWNVYNEGDYVELHNHYHAGVSGFYILDLPDNQTNSTVFAYQNLYPLSSKTSMTELRYYAEDAIEGDVLLFPSSLNHYVNPSKGRKVSISFNIEVTFE
jgi:hypothetical protein